MFLEWEQRALRRCGVAGDPECPVHPEGSVWDTPAYAVCMCACVLLHMPCACVLWRGHERFPVPHRYVWSCGIMWKLSFPWKLNHSSIHSVILLIYKMLTSGHTLCCFFGGCKKAEHRLAAFLEFAVLDRERNHACKLLRTKIVQIK